MDKTNRAILALLARDARIPWQQLGKRVHLTGQAVSARVQQMLDDGIIRCFTILRGDLRRHYITVFMPRCAMPCARRGWRSRSAISAAGPRWPMSSTSSGADRNRGQPDRLHDVVVQLWRALRAF